MLPFLIGGGRGFLNCREFLPSELEFICFFFEMMNSRYVLALDMVKSVRHGF